MASFRFKREALLSLSGCILFSLSAFGAESPSPSTAKVTVYPLVKEGYDLLQKGSYMEAVQSLCQAVVLDRDDVSARRYLALALIKIDNADRALEQMGLVGRLAQPSAFDYFIYGEAYFAMGKYKEAEDAYRRSLELEKDQLSDADRAGVVKSLVGALDFDKATAECQKYLKQAKTKEQKAYYQTMLKKVKEAKAGPPAENQEETPPAVPAPAPAQAAITPTPTSSTPASTPPGNSFIGPPLPTTAPQSAAPASTAPQTPPPLSSPLQPTPVPAQPVTPKLPGVMPKTSLPSLKSSATLP
jgi:tetratricopeptide (TPR) repeat protein